jgi:hypothetical protein
VHRTDVPLGIHACLVTDNVDFVMATGPTINSTSVPITWVTWPQWIARGTENSAMPAGTASSTTKPVTT